MGEKSQNSVSLNLVIWCRENLIFIYLSIFIQIFCTYVFYNYREELEIIWEFET